ncbi:DUF3509 domain-containing protein [Pseudomonas sp.]|uniref:DUF3509 domain-containing protein n=1 Tax=Pseudomonas sp. TaxID=306 RepID=UPI00260DFCE3|nr:DUF3509 domain-containing protein [Pseudomonas sp.]
MENISLLLTEALTPYQASLGPSGANGERVVTLRNAAGAIVIERTLCVAQLRDKRQLTDVVDGFHRDLLISEGRIEPCVLAAMRHATQVQVFTSFQAFN